MSDTEGSTPTEDRPGDPAQEERHVSFVQRLSRHFGEDVDPEINLQDADESSDGDSSTSLGLVKKLSGQVQLGSRYTIVRQIAQGGMGTILRVWDDDLRRNLAMKVLNSHSSVKQGSTVSGDYDQEKLGRFLEEAQITGQLDHPGIVPVHELGIDEEGRLFFTMRLVRGRELKEVLDRTRRGEEDLTLTKALGLILKVCESMAFAHSKGVVHRDLKPSNVMVGRYGEVYVMDWGLARVLGRESRRAADEPRPEPKPEPRSDASSLSLVRTVRKDESEANPDSPLITMDGDVVGTPCFMAPEQARGKLDEVGPRSDVYSLGCILYYLLSGRAPYMEPGERVSPHTVLNRVLQGPPTPISELVSDQPPELIAICEKAMARDKEERYADMMRVAGDIEDYLGDRVVRAYEGGSAAEIRKWITRNRPLTAAVAGILLVVLLSAIGFVAQKNKRIRELNDSTAKRERVLADLEVAKDEADQNAREARANLLLAQEREKDAARNESLAITGERQARNSVYMANVLAASFSDALHDVEEMRARLQDTDPRLREWEWNHLRARARPELLDLQLLSKLPVDRIQWTRDGSQLMALSRAGSLSLLHPDTGSPIGEPIGRPVVNTVGMPALASLEMAVSSDETQIAIAGNDATIRILDMEADGAERLTLPTAGTKGHEARVGALAFGKEGRLLASGADNGTIFVWDAMSGEFFGFPRHAGGITDLAWSPDSLRIASASTDGMVRIWDVFLGQEVHRLEGHQGAVRCVTWDDTGERLFSGGDNGLISQWNAQRGTLISTLSGHTGPVLGLDFDRDSGRLASASRDRTLRVWDPAGGEPVVLQGHLSAVVDVDFAPDGVSLVSSAEDGQIKLWDPRGDLSVTDLDLHEGRVEALAFSPDGNHVVTGDEEGDVVIWDAFSGEPLRRLRDHDKAITDLAFDLSSGTFFSASLDGSVRQYSIGAAGTAVPMANFAHDAAVTGVLVMPEGRILTSCADDRVRIYQVETQLLVQEFMSGQRSLFDLNLHPGGDEFVCRRGSDLVILDVEGQRSERVLPRRGGFEDCDVSPLGETLVSASRDAICLWDLASGSNEEVEARHNQRFRRVAFAPSGKRFASGADDGEVSVRGADDGASLLDLKWAGASVSSLAWSADGTRLIAGAEDGRVRIWETSARGERRRRWLAQRGKREEVSPIVEGLFDGYFYLRDVLGEIQADSSLDQELRQTAIRLANLRGDDPDTLHVRSLMEALLPGGEPESYDLALRRVEAALEMEGAAQRPALYLALGVTQYRVGRVRDAMLSLELAGSLNEGAPTGESSNGLSLAEDTLRLLFLAMARAGEGHRSTATSALEEARSLLAAHPEVASEDTRIVSVLAEAERTVEGDE